MCQCISLHRQQKKGEKSRECMNGGGLAPQKRDSCCWSEQRVYERCSTLYVLIAGTESVKLRRDHQGEGRRGEVAFCDSWLASSCCSFSSIFDRAAWIYSSGLTIQPSRQKNNPAAGLRTRLQREINSYDRNTSLGLASFPTCSVVREVSGATEVRPCKCLCGGGCGGKAGGEGGGRESS